MSDNVQRTRSQSSANGRRTASRPVNGTANRGSSRSSAKNSSRKNTKKSQNNKLIPSFVSGIVVVILCLVLLFGCKILFGNNDKAKKGGEESTEVNSDNTDNLVTEDERFQTKYYQSVTYDDNSEEEIKKAQESIEKLTQDSNIFRIKKNNNGEFILVTSNDYFSRPEGQFAMDTYYQKHANLEIFDRDNQDVPDLESVENPTEDNLFKQGEGSYKVRIFQSDASSEEEYMAGIFLINEGAKKDNALFILMESEPGDYALIPQERYFSTTGGRYSLSGIDPEAREAVVQRASNKEDDAKTFFADNNEAYIEAYLFGDSEYEFDNQGHEWLVGKSLEKKEFLDEVWSKLSDTQKEEFYQDIEDDTLKSMAKERGLFSVNNILFVLAAILDIIFIGAFAFILVSKMFKNNDDDVTVVEKKVTDREADVLREYMKKHSISANVTIPALNENKPTGYRDYGMKSINDTPQSGRMNNNDNINDNQMDFTKYMRETAASTVEKEVEQKTAQPTTVAEKEVVEVVEEARETHYMGLSEETLRTRSSGIKVEVKLQEQDLDNTYKMSSPYILYSDRTVGPNEYYIRSKGKFAWANLFGDAVLIQDVFNIEYETGSLISNPDDIGKKKIRKVERAILNKDYTIAKKGRIIIG